MGLNLAPPPIQVPSDFMQNKTYAAFFTALINTLYQMWVALYSIRTTAKVITTDASNTAMLRVTVPRNKTVMIEARIVARRNDDSTAGTLGDSGWYVLTGAYKNIGGVLTGIAAANLYGGEDQVGWNVGFSTSAEDAIVTVTGAVNNKITWEGTISSYEVGA